MNSADIIDVPVRTAGIRLGQFLKLANVVEDGVQAREEIAAVSYTHLTLPTSDLV